MRASNKPAAELSIDEALVRRLLAEQHPDLADRTLVEVAAGWDNVVYRLGDELAIRLPRRALGAELVDAEHRWLPQLAPRLPLPIPAPIRVGHPTGTYPWRWSIVPWLPGRSAAETPPAEPAAAAALLGQFVFALHQSAPPDAPVNPYRGGPLADRHAITAERIEKLDPSFDRGSIRRRWDDLVDTSPWEGPKQWIHGDLHPGNIVVDGGRITAVLDFGDLTAGDPATDLSVAWMMLPTEHRHAFRAASGADDDAMWRRGQAWALSLAAAYLSASADDPVMAGIGRRTMHAALTDPPAP